MKQKFPAEILRTKRESKKLDFKSKFDPNIQGDWCELLKDIAAIANSGGGDIIIGLNNDATVSKIDVQAILSLDLATICDKIRSYTGDDFSDIQIMEAKKRNYKLAIIHIGASQIPLIFIKPGTYPIDQNRQKTAFGLGTLYFRHGAKSEPGSSRDLKLFVEQYIRKYRQNIFGNLRKVIEAPTGHKVQMLPPNVYESKDPTATPIRRVDSPDAPAYRFIPSDQDYPYRQKEVAEFINQKTGKSLVKPFDIQAIRKVHDIDKNPKFSFRPKFGSRQFSEAFPKWILDQFNLNKSFLETTKEAFKILS